MTLLELLTPFLDADGFFPLFAAATTPQTKGGIVTVVILIKDKKFNLYGWGELSVSSYNLQPGDAYLGRTLKLIASRTDLIDDEKAACYMAADLARKNGLGNTPEFIGFMNHFGL